MSKEELLSASEFANKLTAFEVNSVKEAALNHFRMFSPDHRNPESFMATCYIQGVVSLMEKKGYKLVKLEGKDGKQ